MLPSHICIGPSTSACMVTSCHIVYWCIMQNFGQHGRELITSEVAVRLLALLASDAELVKFCALQGIPAARLLASLKHVAMKVSMQLQLVLGTFKEHFTSETASSPG